MLKIDAIKVQVIHGDPLVAAGLKAALREQVGIDVVDDGHCGSGDTVPVDRPDVVVADFEQGLALLTRSAALPVRRPGDAPRVLIVTPRDTECEIRHALERGARGYLLLGCGIEELVAGVRALHLGVRHIGARAAERLADSVVRTPLTDREQEVLRLVAQGQCNKAIAHGLQIATGTVKAHLKAIFEKLGARNRTEVAAVAERRGLLSLPDAGASGPTPAPGHPAPHWAAGSARHRPGASGHDHAFMVSH